LRIEGPEEVLYSAFPGKQLASIIYGLPMTRSREIYAAKSQ
jgi:hypothetical protein